MKRLVVIAILTVAGLASVADTASAFGLFRRCGGGCFSGCRSSRMNYGCNSGGCNNNMGGCNSNMGGCNNGGCNPGMRQPAAPGAAPTNAAPAPGPAPAPPAPAA